MFQTTMSKLQKKKVKFQVLFKALLTLVMLNLDLSFFENTVEPDQLASDEAI